MGHFDGTKPPRLFATGGEIPSLELATFSEIKTDTVVLN
jgi:hypothetical protein